MIVNAIIGLGKSLKLPTTAEGIESLADAEHLAALGCSVTTTGSASLRQ